MTYVATAPWDVEDPVWVARCDVVLVTYDVGSGIVTGTSSGRLFRDLLGRASALVAAACHDVERITVGLPITTKGQPWAIPT